MTPEQKRVIEATKKHRNTITELKEGCKCTACELARAIDALPADVGDEAGLAAELGRAHYQIGCVADSSFDRLQSVRSEKLDAYRKFVEAAKV